MSYKKNIFLTISGYLFLLIPFFLITGPFLSDLALSIIVILTLVYAYQNSMFRIFKNKYFIIFSIFYLYLIINSLFQNQNFDSIKISFTYLRFGIFFIAVIYIIKNDNLVLKKLYYLFFFIFSALILDGFFQFFYEKNILGYPLSVGPRVSSFFDDELILGSYMSRLFPIFFGLVIYFEKEISKFQYIICCMIFIFSEILIYLSGERAAFFYMNLSAIFILIALKNYRKLRLTTFLISLILIFSISILFPNTKQRVFNQTFEQMGLSSDKKLVLFSIQHNEIFKAAYNIFKDNIYFGVGVKNFRYECKLDKYNTSNFSCSTHPHNSYLQLLSELGLIGFFFGIFVLILFSKTIINHFIFKFKNKIYYYDF